MATIIDAYRVAFEATPAELVQSRTVLANLQWENLVGAHYAWSVDVDPTDVPGNELWPLVSHHRFPGDTPLRGLFADDPNRLSQHALANLLLCHGLIVADPLIRPLEALRQDGQREAARVELVRLTRALAHLQPLIDADLIRTTRAYEPVDSPVRTSVHAGLGFGPDLSVVTYAIEEALLSPAREDPEGRTYVEGWRQIGAAAVELSWQLAAVAQLRGAADLFLTNPLEGELFDLLLNSEASALADLGVSLDAVSVGAGEGRHLHTIAVADAPALDASALTVADATAVRLDGVFDGWRRTLSVALDGWTDARDRGRPLYEADAIFRDRISAAVAQADLELRNSRFSTRARRGAFPTALTVVNAAVSAAITHDPVAMLASIAGAFTVSAIIVEWLSGRRKAGASAVRRFAAAFTL